MTANWTVRKFEASSSYIFFLSPFNASDFTGEFEYQLLKQTLKILL